MTPRRRSAPFDAGAALAVAAIAAAIALGVILRLDDPLSSSVVPAEDPYTHMALVREHLRDGAIEPLHEGRDLYPPGLHGFLAAAWVTTGVDLYEMARLGPVFLGAIGLLGMALLLWRHAGPGAAFVGVLALAVMPEAIFRTTMMSPTALDLALLPFFLFALLEVVAGRLAWMGVALPMAIFVALAHPWVFAMLCLAGAIFVFLVAAIPWSPDRAPRVSGRGLAASAAILGLGTVAAAIVAKRGGDGVGLDLVRLVADWRAVLVLAVGAALAALGGLARRVPAAGTRSRAAGRMRPLRPIASGGLLAYAAALVLTAHQAGMPEFVNLPRMFGWPVLALAAGAFVALPYVGGRIACAAAALVAATLPFVVHNPLQSPFWPHRTAVFLGLGMALLAGAAAPSVVRAAARAFSLLRREAAAASGITPDAGSGGWTRGTVAVTSVSLLVLAGIGGVVVAATPAGYDEGWYRLFHECELDALRAIAQKAESAPEMIVVSGDWRATLVLAALASNASRFWTDDPSLAFFESPGAREDLLWWTGREGRPVLVVTDVYLSIEDPDADPSFLRSSPWEDAGQWCTAMGQPGPRVAAYAVEGRGP